MMQGLAAAWRGVRVTALAFAVVTASGGAWAQGLNWQSGGHYAGAALGKSDYGTGFRLFGGGSVTHALGWEAQFTSFGSERYTQGNSTVQFRRSAWSAGANLMLKHTLSDTLSVFGKAGLHYLRSEASGPALDRENGSVKFGIGAGALWWFTPDAGLRLDAENIGGGGGDLISVGLQVRL